MLNSPLLKVKLPYADSKTTIEEAFNYAIKTLNSSFSIAEETIVTPVITPVTPPTGISFSDSFSYTGGNYVKNITFTHSFGAIPTGFDITDFTSDATLSAYEHYTIVRTSWTSTQISVKLSYYNGSGAISGSFKILVLR